MAGRWLVVVLLLFACDGGEQRPPARPPSPSRVVLRPGDTVFDHLERVLVDRYSKTNLPRDVAAKVRRLVAGNGWTLPPGAWRRTTDGLDVAPEHAALLGASGPLQGFEARPPADLDLALGELWFEHEGRPLAPQPRRPGDREILLFDKTSHTAFGWMSHSRRLVAWSDGAPGEVVYGYGLDGEHELTRWERLLVAGGQRPGTAADLVDRVALGAVERPCLAAPVPTQLTLRVDRLLGTGLDVVVSAVDLGLTAAGGRLHRAEGLSDGVEFAIQVLGRDGTREEVWARHVEAGIDFLEHTIDLTRWHGQNLKLRLITRPGPEGDRDFDYGLWSELRIVGEPEQAPRRPHVVLVDVDTLRADRLGCYGYDRPTSPRIDAWAAERATVFTDCMAANNWTLPSTVSMLTGLSVSQHGVLLHARRITEAMRPLALRLREAGYETRARTDGAWLGPAHGFGLGFDVFDSRPRTREERRRVGWQVELDWLASRRSRRPVFLFLQSYQVHGPFPDDRRFESPERPYEGELGLEPVTRQAVDELEARRGALDAADRQYINDLYDAGVRRMDDVVGAFLEDLDAALGGERCLVILTSDHGEELFDHGDLGHGQTLHAEQLAVPLIISWPDRDRVGTDDRPASGLDLVPTILDVAGLPRDPRLAGLSLLRDGPSGRLRVAEHLDTARAVRWGVHKLVHGRWNRSEIERTELYDVSVDPTELIDIAGRRQDVVRNLQSRLGDLLRRHPPLDDAAGPATTPLRDDVVEQLRELGYLGDG